MSNKNYEVVNLKTTTPEHIDTNTTVYGRYNEKGEFVPDGRTFKTYSESVAPPSAEAVQYFNETVRPLTEKQHGLEFDDKGNLTTPLSRFVHFDPEKERQRREQEQKLNEWKRKEANWYNGISVLMDIATAAGGGKVGKRTPSDAAAQAVADNERLRKEQQAEDYAVQKVKQDKLAAFYSDLNEKYKALQGKVRQEVSDKPMQITQKTTPEVVSDRQQVVRHSDKSDKDNKGGKKEYSIVVNTGSSNAPKKEKVTISQDDYTKIGNMLAAYYQDVFAGRAGNDLSQPTKPKWYASGQEKEAYGKAKEAYDAQEKSRGALQEALGSYYHSEGDEGSEKYTWNLDKMLSNGVLYNLPQDVKDYITNQSGGKIKFGTPVKMDNGLIKETIIIDNGDDAGWGGMDNNQYDD